MCRIQPRGSKQHRQLRGTWAELYIAQHCLRDGARRVYHNLKSARVQIDLLALYSKQIHIIEVKLVSSWDLSASCIKHKQLLRLQNIQQTAALCSGQDVVLQWYLVDMFGRYEVIQDF